MNKVQIVSYAKKTETWPKYAECTTLEAPLSPDSFSYNFYDLTDNILWRFHGSQYVSINSIDDFQSVQTMLKKSSSAVNIVVLPQNLEFFFDYDPYYKRYGKRCGFSKRYFLVLVACRHLTCTKTECRKMFLSLIAPLTTIRLNRGKRSNRLPYIFAQGQER